MSAKARISSGTGRRSLQFSARYSAGLVLAALLLAGAASATPINSLGSNDTSDAKRLVSAVSNQSAAQPAVNAGPMQQLGATSLPATSGDGCVFTSSCYAIVTVPEPQSLAMVGSGLLAMAGLLRRRRR